MRVLSVRGEGPPVLFLHGSPSPPEAFEPLAEALAPTHRVAIGALPGYSGVPPLVPYDLERLHQGIEGALLGESQGPWSLVGFSLGSYHVLAIALRRNVAVHSVAMLGALPGLPDEMRPAYRDMAPAVRSGAVPAETLPPRMLSPGYLAAHPEARDAVLDWLRSTSLEVVGDEIAAMGDAPNLLPLLAGADFRLLVRTGALDAATPVSFSEAIAKALPRATLEIVPNAGHALLYEDLAGTRDSLVEFLRPR